MAPEDARGFRRTFAPGEALDYRSQEPSGADEFEN
jgi:hypothetical protein